MDTVSVERRSEIMSRVRGKGMRPEMIVRRLVHGLGYRYRLHGRGLPESRTSSSRDGGRRSSSMGASGIVIRAAPSRARRSRASNSGAQNSMAI